MFFIKLMLVLLLVFLLQVSFFYNLRTFYIDIDLIFITVAFYPIFFGIRKGIIASGFLGLLRDVVSSNVFGFYFYLYIIFSLLIYVCVSRLHKDGLLNQMLIVFVAITFLKLIHIWFYLALRDAISLNIIPYNSFLLNIICTSLFAPFFFYIFKKVHCYE